MKRVITVENLYQQAVKNSRKTGVGYARTMRRGHAVYEVFVDRTHRIACLRHYGTITVLYDLNSREITSWYGEGVSDRDSMNTFLNCLQDDKYYFRYGTNMGFNLELDGELIPVDEAAKDTPLPVSLMQ
jgi:hypothetical protein